MSERKALRESLHCKSFKWYLDNIYPELPLPSKSINIGEVRLNVCVLWVCVVECEYMCVCECVHVCVHMCVRVCMCVFAREFPINGVNLLQVGSTAMGTNVAPSYIHCCI